MPPRLRKGHAPLTTRILLSFHLGLFSHSGSADPSACDPTRPPEGPRSRRRLRRSEQLGLQRELHGEWCRSRAQSAPRRVRHGAARWPGGWTARSPPVPWRVVSARPDTRICDRRSAGRQILPASLPRTRRRQRGRTPGAGWGPPHPWGSGTPGRRRGPSSQPREFPRTPCWPAPCCSAGQPFSGEAFVLGLMLSVDRIAELDREGPSALSDEETWLEQIEADLSARAAELARREDAAVRALEARRQQLAQLQRAGARDLAPALVDGLQGRVGDSDQVTRARAQCLAARRAAIRRARGGREDRGARDRAARGGAGPPGGGPGRRRPGPSAQPRGAPLPGDERGPPRQAPLPQRRRLAHRAAAAHLRLLRRRRGRRAAVRVTALACVERLTRLGRTPPAWWSRWTAEATGTTAANAVVRVDGVPRTRTSNSVTDATPNTTLTLKAESGPSEAAPARRPACRGSPGR
jgi:hypothetical protein